MAVKNVATNLVSVSSSGVPIYNESLYKGDAQYKAAWDAQAAEQQAHFGKAFTNKTGAAELSARLQSALGADWQATQDKKATDAAQLANPFKMSTADQQAIQTANASRITNPTLSPGQTITPVAQQVQGDELLTNPGTLSTTGADIAPQTVAPAAQAQTPADIIAAQGTAAQAETVQAAQADPLTANKYDATLVTNDQVGTATAAQGSFTEDELVTGQLAKLYSGVDFDNPPAWASGAMRAASTRLASMGMNNSSMGAAAIVTAVMEAATPIATADAQSLQGIKLQNLSNEQAANLTTFQARVNVLLSNQSATNASKQFNATSDNQTQQFMASLAAQINQQNADRAQAINVTNATLQTTMSQFNTEQQNDVSKYMAGLQVDTSKFNAEQTNAMAQLQAQMNFQVADANSKLETQRDQFNISNAMVIQQSNAEWRRQINTQNNQQQNYSNMINALNTLEISNSAYQNAWQQYRDEAAWRYNASESASDRAQQMALYASGNSAAAKAASNASTSALYSQIGSFATGLFTNGSTDGKSTSSTYTNSTGASIVNSISNLFSDRRAKRDVVWVAFIGGYNYYSYSYLWDDTKHFGVMADEVEIVNPDAVTTDPDTGYLMVNYERL